MRDRRRRVLTEEAEAAVPAVRLAKATNPAELYSDSGRAARLNPISGLFPLRKLSISLVAGSALLAIAGCLGLHMAAEQLQLTLGSRATSALRLDSPAALARWLSSTLLGLAALTALFIYSLRKHRIDDYHGRYRVWLTMTLACLAASIVESTGIAALANELGRKASAVATLRFEIAWPAAIATLVTLLGIRLLFEIRRCGPALSALVLAMIAFTGAAAVDHQWPVEVSQASQPLWLGGCWLSGYVLILLTFLLYSRRVQVEIAGTAVLGTKAKPKRKKAASTTETPAPAPAKKPAIKVRTDLDPVETTEPERIKEAKPAAVSISIEPEQAAQRMSRAERKRLRHEQRKAS